MPVYEFEGPNGKRYQVEAATPDEAQKGFAQTVATSPMLFAKPGVAAALKDYADLQTMGGKYPRRSTDNLTQRMTDAASLGLSTQFNAGLGAAGTGVLNLIPGLKKPYSAKDYYDAVRLYENAQQATLSKKHPLMATMADITGSLAMPGATQVGKFIVGKTAPALAAAGEKVPLAVRAGQTARGAAAAGVQTGALAAATAQPGEEVERGKEGAVAGALLAPAASLGAGAAAKLAPALGRTAQRIVGPVVRGTPKGEPVLGDLARRVLTPPDAEITTVEKLVKALRREGLKPEALQAARDAWEKTGGVSPTLLDILKDAGASPGVMVLLRRSGAQAPGRVAAETYARDTVEGVQKKALEEAGKLPTGEPRTPVQIRADLEARIAEAEAKQAATLTRVTRKADTKAVTVDKRLDKTLAGIDETALNSQIEPPAAPVRREQGAAAFADDINAKYDASKKVYEDAYKQAEAAKPESAIVAPDEIRPLFTKIYSELGQPNPDSSGVKAVTSYLEGLRTRTAPGSIADWPKGDAPQGEPLTVLQLEHARQMMNEFATKHQGTQGEMAALKVKKTLDGELERLATEDKIVGDDPEVVDKWRTAILGYAQHQEKFGSGLAAKLTERTPGKPGERIVQPWRAADVIFGDRAEGSKPLNTVLNDLEPALAVASPESTEALKGELYGRLKPEDLAKLMNGTGGEKLLPRDLVEASLAAQKANRATEEAAAASREAATAAAEGRKTGIDLAAHEATRKSNIALAAERAGPDAERKALETGEGALSTPSEAFAPAVEGLDTAHLPVVAAGAKQAVLDTLETPPPEATGVLRSLMGERAGKNLGTVLGEENVGSMQARMRNIEAQARNAQELELMSGAGSSHESPLVENVGPYDIVNPKRGMADLALTLSRLRERLSPQEYLKAVEVLTREGGLGVDTLLPRLLKRYPQAKRAATPALVRPLGREGDDDLEKLKLDYGL